MNLFAFLLSMEYLSKSAEDSIHKGKVWCIVRTGRNLSRFKQDRTLKQDRTFSDAPDTPQDEGAVSKSISINIPSLILIQQNGREELEWRGAPFWWPILVVPKNVKTVIFASELIEVQPETIV